jgi:hypothetical protein
MSQLSRLAAALTCVVFAHVSLADTIHANQEGSYYHHQSGWIFPGKIGDFSLVGIPQDINGTVDVAAWYARESKGVRTVVSVSVYPPDSAQPAFKEGKSSRAIVYFVETGAWIVRVRSTIAATDKATAPLLEAFVRNQRWDSLQLTP